MPVTNTWVQGLSALTWSLPTSVPSAAPAELTASWRLKGHLQPFESLLALAAEAVGASVPSVVLLLVATRAAQHLLASATETVLDSSALLPAA